MRIKELIRDQIRHINNMYIDITAPGNNNEDQRKKSYLSGKTTAYRVMDLIKAAQLDGIITEAERDQYETDARSAFNRLLTVKEV